MLADQHTLYLKTDISNSELKEIFNRQLDCDYVLTTVIGLNNKILGSLIYIEDEKFYHFLLDRFRFDFEPALIAPINDKLVYNVIKSSNCTKLLTKDLKDQFKIFAPNKAIHLKKIGSLIFRDCYPFVHIIDDIGYVIFDHRTNDAQFALLVCRKIMIGNVELNFNHASIRDRI